MTIPPIWTNLQIFCHLNRSQNKVLCDWKEEEIVNLKSVALCNKNRCNLPLSINGHFFPLTLLNVSSFTSNFYFVSINSVRIIRKCRVVTIEMKLVLTNYLPTAEETEAASEVVLDAFAHSLMKLRCHKCIYTAKF